MSLSISPSPAAPSSDGAADSAASTNFDPSGLPFEAILNDQAEATDTEADPIAGLLRGVALGVRTRLTREDDVAPDAAILSALGKDRSANEAAALALLVVQDVLQRLESFDSHLSVQEEESAPPNVPAGPAVDNRLVENLRAALRELVTAAPVEDAPSGEAAPPIANLSSFVDIDAPSMADLLRKETIPAQADKETTPAQTDKTPVSDEPLTRPAVASPAAVLVDAVRTALGDGASSEPDTNVNQPANQGIDRRSLKSITVPALHLAEAGARIESNTPGTAALPATVAPLPNETGVVSSIIQTMRLQMRDGVGTALVHLEPDYLGAVSIALRVQNGVVTASLHAENPQVRAWMEANAPLLSESLAGQGLSLDRLVVTDERIADERSADRGHQQEQEQHARPRPRRDDTSTFEVIV